LIVATESSYVRCGWEKPGSADIARTLSYGPFQEVEDLEHREAVRIEDAVEVEEELRECIAVPSLEHSKVVRVDDRGSR
jgi:hypothetical protein